MTAHPDVYISIHVYLRTFIFAFFYGMKFALIVD